MDYILSADNDFVDPEHYKVYQNMDQPLSHYFINAAGPLSFSVGATAQGSQTMSLETGLKLGVRYIEMRCVNGRSGVPQVVGADGLYATFEDVLMTVQRKGFVVSPFPLILSLDVRCNSQQQEIMAMALTRIVGDRLAPPLPSQKVSGGEEPALPSPRELRGKILIEVKGGEDLWADAQDVFTPETAGQIQTLTPSLDHIVHLHIVPFNSVEHSYEHFDPSKTSQMTANRLSRVMSRQLARLQDDMRSASYDRLPLASPTASASSLSLKPSASATNLLGRRRPELQREMIEHNCWRLMRVVARDRSGATSSYDPTKFWVQGVQVCALDWREQDVALWTLQSRFRINGNSGYVLKPDVLRPLTLKSSGSTCLQGPVRRVRIKVICGRHLPKAFRGDNSTDCYVVLECIGTQVDTRRFQTAAVKDNGYRARWEETFEFEFKYPALVLLRIFAYDRLTGVCLAHRIVPVDSLRSGMRWVYMNGRLQDNDKVVSMKNAGLLVNIRVERNAHMIESIEDP